MCVQLQQHHPHAVSANNTNKQIVKQPTKSQHTTAQLHVGSSRKGIVSQQHFRSTPCKTRRNKPRKKERKGISPIERSDAAVQRRSARRFGKSEIAKFRSVVVSDQNVQRLQPKISFSLFCLFVCSYPVKT